MASIYEIVQGLSQAAANAYDGALGEDYEPVKVGALRREEGDMLIDQRVMDGFNVKFYGDMMCLTYQSEIKLKEVYVAGFESDTDQRLEDIAKWIQKEYKRIQGSSVSLVAEGEIDVRVENASRSRTWVVAKKHYRIGGLSEEMRDDNSGNMAPVEKSWETFLNQGGWGKRPPNDTRKKES